MGGIFAIELANYIGFSEYNFVTPLDKSYIDSSCRKSGILLVSTFKDNEYFAQTIGEYYRITNYAKIMVDREECRYSKFRNSYKSK